MDTGRLWDGTTSPASDLFSPISNILTNRPRYDVGWTPAVEARTEHFLLS
jgi:hypothetical protein